MISFPRSLAIVLILLFVQSTQGEVIIKGSIQAKIPFKIHYTNPVNGVCFRGFRESVKPDSDGGFVINTDVKKPAFIFLQFSDKLSRYIVIEPGYSYEIQADLDNNTVKFTGSQAKGQELYNSFPRPVMAQVESKPFIRDTSFTSVSEKIAALKESDLSKLKNLLDANEISKGFYELVKTDRDYYYSTLKTSYPLFKFLESMSRTPEKSSSAIKKFWEEVFAENSPADQALMSSPYGFEYLQNYLYFRNYTDKDFTPAKQREYLNSGKVHTHYTKYISPGLQEFYQASYLFFNAMQNEYEKELISLSADFEKNYPGSGYFTYLKPLIEKVVAFHKAAEKEFGKEVIFVKNYEKLNSLKECIAALQGKKIFIDIWATWCGPCKAEFAHKEQLKEILKQKDIKLLYISIDEDRNDGQWKDMIKFYDLDGYHLRANKQLVSDLRALYNQNGGIAIPWYLIVNDNGEIIKTHAANPSNPERLKKEVSQL